MHVHICRGGESKSFVGILPSFRKQEICSRPLRLGFERQRSHTRVCCFGCSKGVSKSVQVLFTGIEAVLVLTLRFLDNHDFRSFFRMYLTKTAALFFTIPTQTNVIPTLNLLYHSHKPTW